MRKLQSLQTHFNVFLFGQKIRLTFSRGSSGRQTTDMKYQIKIYKGCHWKHILKTMKIGVPVFSKVLFPRLLGWGGVGWGGGNNSFHPLNSECPMLQIGFPV